METTDIPAVTAEAHPTVPAMHRTVHRTMAGVLPPVQATAAAVRHPTAEAAATAGAVVLLQEEATAEVHQEVTDVNLIKT